MPRHIFIPQYITNGVAESGSSGTLRKDLPKNEQISHIQLELRATRAASPSNAQSIFDCFSKIEVVADGTKTLFSLTSENADYAAYVAQNGRSPDNRFYSGQSAVNRLHIPIYFGRFPWDEEYMLDTGLYNNVEIVITWNLATTNETFVTFTHTITYWRPLEKLAPVGIVRSREVRNQASPGASAEHQHDLPVALPWHYLWVRVLDQDQDINTNLTALQLNVDAGRLLLYDVDADEIYYADKLRYNHAIGPHIQPAVTGQENVKTHAEWSAPLGGVNVDTSFMHVQLDNVAGEQIRATILDAAGAQMATLQPFTFHGRYQNPHKCLTLFDGKDMPFPAQDHGEAFIEYTTGSTAPDNLITCVSELVSGAL